MQPFNLERALAGDKVVMRNGSPVSIERQDINGLIYGNYDGIKSSWYNDGSASYLQKTHPLDLFMAD